MPRAKKPKAPRPEGEIGAPIIEPIIEEKREEKREKYTVHAISDEEYRAFGNTNRKSEIKEVAEDIIKRVLESKTPLMNPIQRIESSILCVFESLSSLF